MAQIKRRNPVPERYRKQGFSRVGQKKKSTRPGKKGYYEDGSGITTYTPDVFLTPSTAQNLFVSLGSAGTGHTLYGLIVRNRQAGLNNDLV